MRGLRGGETIAGAEGQRVGTIPGDTLANVPVVLGALGFTFETSTRATVGIASGELIAAEAVDAERVVLIFVPDGADTGIHINFGAVAAATNFLIAPGLGYIFNSLQQIRAIRGGAADVTVDVITGVRNP